MSKAILTPNSFLTRAELSETIATLFGINITVNALGQQYIKGTGFPGHKIGGKVLYLWAECLEEMDRILKAPRRSTRPVNRVA